MSLTAQYVDGELITQKNTTTTTSKATNATSTETTKGSNSLDKDAFLQLLVAQMKYQDPLEPTSNTEYISQYATFSELEQMQNVSANTTLQRATELVGKEVVVESQNAKGDTTQTQGYVEKVVYNGTKAYLVIDGSQYSIDDLKTVIDGEYKTGVETVDEIKKILGELPKLDNVSLNDADKISTAYTYYKSLTEYQLSLLPDDTAKTLDSYVEKINTIVNAALAEKENASNEEAKENIDKLFEDSNTEEV